MSDEILRDLNRLVNDRAIPHRGRNAIQEAISLIRQLEQEAENSHTFEQFLAAAKRDNKKNIGKGRKFTVWMDAIKQELKQEE